MSYSTSDAIRDRARAVRMLSEAQQRVETLEKALRDAQNRLLSIAFDATAAEKDARAAL